MDIYQYINSKDIRTHLHNIGYRFNALEAAWLVYRHRGITKEKRHAAWREIIANLPDTDIPYGRWKAPRESVHAFLRDYMALEDRLLREFYDTSGFCAYNYYEPEHNDLLVDHRGIFHNLDACLSAAQTAMKEHGSPEIAAYRIDLAYGHRVYAAFNAAGDVLRIRPEYELFEPEEAILRDSFAALKEELSFMRPFIEGELLYDDADEYLYADEDGSIGYAGNGNALNTHALYPKACPQKPPEGIPEQISGFRKNESAADRRFMNAYGEKNELVLLMAKAASSAGFPFRFSPPGIPPRQRPSDGFYGIPQLDRHCLGSFASDLIGLASFGGVSAQAKENVLFHTLLHHAVDRQESVLFFSIKTKAAEIWRRLLQLLSGCDPSISERLPPEERDRLWNAYYMLLGTHLTVIDAPETDAEAVEYRLKNAHPDLVVIDSLQRFNPIPELEDQRERVQYAHIVYSLKQLAKEYGAPILLTAQLPLPPGSTPGQQPEPTLRDFDRTVSNADFDMLLLVRAERGEEIAEASLVKNRHGDCAAAHFEFAG